MTLSAAVVGQLLAGGALPALGESRSGPSASPAASGAAARLANAGFETTASSAEGEVPGWVLMQHAGPKSYEFSVDESTAADGKRSLRIVNVGREPFGMAAQRVEAATLRGKTVRASAAMRTRAVSGRGAGLAVRVESGSHIIAHDLMRGRLLRGDNDWRRVEISIAVPAQATHIEIGAMLRGPGTLWVDDVRIESTAAGN